MTDEYELPLDTHSAAGVADEVYFERGRQDARWGEQNHPDGTSDWFSAQAAATRNLNDRLADEGALTWRGILVEEVWEAFAETDQARLRAELIQVAAVACAWVEAIDRRTRDV